MTARTPISQAQPASGWALLQQGKPGYVVLMRHALAPGVGDPASFRLNDCSTQRNLSAAGRSQAKRIGEAFRRYNVRVSRVLSSQWCRCLETARLLNLGPVEAFAPLNSFFQDRSTEAKQTAQVRRLIVNHRKQAGVLILVTHQVNITALTGVVPQSGESIVLQANDRGQVRLLGSLPDTEPSSTHSTF